MADDRRQSVLREVLGDDMLAAMQTLRVATDALVWWPWSTKRRLALHAALEDVMAMQVNRVMSMAGSTALVLERRLAVLEQRFADGDF